MIPHCSTGGLPSYTLKQIQTFKDKYDISVIEQNFYGENYVAQRNKIKQICPFYPLYGKQEELMPLLNKLKPDIISIQELPESFLQPEVLRKLYSNDRHYNIVVTTHSSLTRGRDFTYMPDRIIAVNKWQRDLFCNEFAGEPITIGMWEYPIEDKRVERMDFSCHDCGSGMSKARKILGFKEFDYRNTSSRHILNIGLFTRGKNQGELFEVARKHPENLYHFVGNQAGNFADYWKPLMENKPDNCIVWGERDDVDLFYQACDEMYFCSRFELNPLVVKEALSYGLPVKMYRLETYGGFYDNNPLVTYL